MSEETVDSRRLEERSRALFQESVERIDMPTRSRLTQARYAALRAAERTARTGWLRLPLLTSAGGVTAAAVLGAALWFGGAGSHHPPPVADSAAALEDLDLVASSDGGADNVEMLQDDLDFYAWADKTAGSEPSA
ncbi:MAG TPA: hypothetical protein VME42_21365 [Steroidobacteraceae bacterium]|nr:hypothetical protein [Steroidobacteraceae bacterium]HUO19914.1 hypothetical protein [Steroidobacteraceae bacterium]